MNDFEAIRLVGEEGPIYHAYGRHDWQHIVNVMRRRRHLQGYSWTEIESRVISKTKPAEIRKRIATYLSTEELADLQIAQWPNDRPATVHFMDETPLNEIGIKRIRRKNGVEKNEYPTPWTTMLRLPARELSPRATEYQAKIWRMRESGRQQNLRQRELDAERQKPRTPRQELEFQLEGYNVFEQAQMRKDWLMKRRQEWIDNRQEERENAPKLRAKAIEVQRQRAAAGSPIKRRTK